MELPDLAYKLEFWVAVLFAVLIKLKTSKTITKVEALTTTLVAVTGALSFTNFFADLLGFSNGNGKLVVTAVVALTCEDMARRVMKMNPKELFDLWKGTKP